MTEEEKRGRGQPKKELSTESVRKLCAMQCTDAELAAFFDVSRKTIERRKKDDPEFAEAMEHGRAKGRASLRHAMFQQALGDLDKGIRPNPIMQIWLSKQHLGMKDKVEHAGEDGGPINILISKTDAQL